MSTRFIESTLASLADPDIAAHAHRFFKTGKGEYGEGDRFLGIRVPVIRAQVKRFRGTALGEVRPLLRSPFHEVRLFALLFLVEAFARGDAPTRKRIYALYLDHTRYINNWDLVDSSAPQIVGGHLEHGDRSILHTLARSDSLWERRIAIMATLHFIRNRQFDDALAVSDQLLHDDQDLIHKAVGWMLREIGKRDPEVERSFLAPRYRTMPRTMLRYAIEKFPETERKQYLSGTR